MDPMDIWFTENHTPDARFSIRINQQLCSVQSRFQRIDVFDSPEFGRFLTLDGLLMLTEKDEYIYHEMITHPGLATNPAIRRILVIGAGDGGTVRELTRYDSIEKIDLVEIDEQVVTISKEYLPFTANKLTDPRVHIHYADGLRFVRQAEEGSYDMIIVDSTDPFGVGEGLFTREFYGNCYKALNDTGILINQHESVFYSEYADAMKRVHSHIRRFFPIALVYQAHIPTYPSGHWLFGFSSKHYDPRHDLNADWWNSLGMKTRYYNTEIHIGSFALPNSVKTAIEQTE